MSTSTPAALPPAAGGPAGLAAARAAAARVPASAWPLLMFVALFVVSGIVRPSLFTLDTLWTTAAFAMILAIASSGQTLAIVQGGIDLSIPNTITVAALTFLSTADSLGPLGAFVLAIAIGALVGLLNGAVVAFLGISPIVMTIAMNGLLFGVVLLAFDMSQLTAVPEIARDLTAEKISLLGTSFPAVIVVGLMLLAALQALLSLTGWGRMLYMVGSAPDMAALAGQSVARIQIVGYVLSGALAAFAGLVIVGFYAQTSTGMGDQYLLGSVAAVVVGGASIFGGSGTMLGTLGGALVLGQIATLTSALNLGVNVQQLVYGAIVLGVVALYGRRGGLVR